MTDRMDLADYVRELTDEHSHAEEYRIQVGTQWETRRHLTRVPSLMRQLWDNDTPSSTVEEGPRPSFVSKPAARLEALDAAARIDLQAAAWVRELGEDDHHLDTAATIRQLHGLVVSTAVEASTRRLVEHDVRRWWVQARIVTGWDSPAWTPDNTCPLCGERGTLRVRLADHIAMCTNDPCRTTWDETSIGLLADHIRAESSAERERRPGRGPCWCPWPQPTVPDLSWMCPACGSARCRHAVGARLVAQLREETRMGA